MLQCEVMGYASKTDFPSIVYRTYKVRFAFYFQTLFPVETCRFKPSSNATANWSAYSVVPMVSMHNRSGTALLSVFRKKMLERKLLVCLSISQFLARPLSDFQSSWRLSLFSCLREKKRNLSKVLFQFITKVCPLWSRWTGRVIVTIWVAGNLSNSVFRAA